MQYSEGPVNENFSCLFPEVQPSFTGPSEGKYSVVVYAWYVFIKGRMTVQNDCSDAFLRRHYNIEQTSLLRLLYVSIRTVCTVVYLTVN
jgi:hypothetical protein